MPASTFLAAFQHTANKGNVDILPLSQMRICVGRPEVAMYVSVNCSRGKHLSEERFFSPPKRYAKANITISDHPMLVRICDKGKISTFPLLAVCWHQARITLTPCS